MSLLLRELLTVVDSLPATIEDDIRSKYRGVISSSTASLNEVKALSGNATLAQRVSASVTALRVLFGTNVVTPESPSYDSLKKANWATNCWLPAAAIVKLNNAVEVALALKVITFTQSVFAVRGRGHNANSGLSSVGESGILLDITRFNEINLSPTKETVYIGAAAMWGDVYEKLEEYSLTAVGGRVNEVGAGGLTLMGGMSHFSNCWGLACDNVQNFEIVLGNSQIIQASAAENPDLFRALKGGGTNLGIATRFDLYTKTEHRVWCKLNVYDAADSERVMAATVEVQKRMEEDDRMGFFLTLQANTLVAGMLYRSEVPPPSVFNVFDQIEPWALAMPATMGTQYSLARVLGSGLSGQMKRQIGTATIRPDARFYVEINQILGATKLPDSVSLQITIQPLGKPAAKIAEESGGDLLGLQPEPQAFLGIVAQWTDGKDDEVASSSIRALISDIKSVAKAKGLLLDLQFLNDAEKSQLPLSGYTPENIARLRAASQKYDPEAVFQILQHSGFLLRDLDIAPSP